MCFPLVIHFLCSMKPSTFRVFVFFLFLVAVLGAGVYFLLLNTPLLDQKGRAPVVVTTHQDFVIATGSIEAQDDVVLSFEDSGSVEDVYYRPGDVVSKGSVIASLDASALKADVEAQRLRVSQEVIRLGSFVEGPEKHERSRVLASTFVSEQMLEKDVRVALVSAQNIVGNVENMMRTDLDEMFDVSDRDYRFTINVPASTKRRADRIRERFEEVFLRWRVLLNNDDVSYRQAVLTLGQLEKDLRFLQSGVTEIYDILLPFRTIQSDGEQAFLLVAKLRDSLASFIVDVVQHSSAVEVAQSKHQLAIAESREDLAGSTKSDRDTQVAQVDIERKKLRQLDLRLAKTRVSAPFDGIVGDVFVTEGEFVSGGTDVVRFISQGGFDLSVDVTEVEIQSVAVDQEMRAHVEASGDEISIRVRTIDATEKRVNDVPVYTVVFDVSSDDVMLRPGMTVDVYIPSGDVADVFSVPRSAVVTKDLKKYVLVERDGGVVLVPVAVGASLEGGSVAVVGDLLVDDIVLFEKKND